MLKREGKVVSYHYLEEFKIGYEQNVFWHHLEVIELEIHIYKYNTQKDKITWSMVLDQETCPKVYFLNCLGQCHDSPNKKDNTNDAGLVRRPLCYWLQAPN